MKVLLLYLVFSSLICNIYSQNEQTGGKLGIRIVQNCFISINKPLPFTLQCGLYSKKYQKCLNNCFKIKKLSGLQDCIQSCQQDDPCNGIGFEIVGDDCSIQITNSFIKKVYIILIFIYVLL
ncbi:hypothetical protein ABPG74_004713 [Tetrahymena malaccensis]